MHDRETNPGSNYSQLYGFSRNIYTTATTAPKQIPE